MPSEYLAEYYAQSMSYVLQRWLESDLVLPASEVAKLYYYILNNSMEEILAKMR
jgi:transcriptional regulator, tetR family